MSPLPPGIRTMDLPGNGPDEIEWEHMLERLDASPLLGIDILAACAIDVTRGFVADQLERCGLTAREILIRCGLDAPDRDEADDKERE